MDTGTPFTHTQPTAPTTPLIFLSPQVPVLIPVLLGIMALDVCEVAVFGAIVRRLNLLVRQVRV